MKKLRCIPLLTLQQNHKYPQLPSVCIASPELGIRFTEERFRCEMTKYYHLHLVSDREIKEDDWVLIIYEKLPLYKGNPEGPLKYNKFIKSSHGTFKKIEATTNQTLKLPNIPMSWIGEKYSRDPESRKEVFLQTYEDGSIKVNYLSKSTEVIIPTIKTNFNRNELKYNMSQAFNLGVNVKALSKNKPTGESYFDNWFEENY